MTTCSYCGGLLPIPNTMIGGKVCTCREPFSNHGPYAIPPNSATPQPATKMEEASILIRTSIGRVACDGSYSGVAVDEILEIVDELRSRLAEVEKDREDLKAAKSINFMAAEGWKEMLTAAQEEKNELTSMLLEAEAIMGEEICGASVEQCGCVASKLRAKIAALADGKEGGK